MCKNDVDAQASARRRPAGAGESGNNDEDQGMSQMRPLHDEMSYLASYSDFPKEEPLGHEDILTGKKVEKSDERYDYKRESLSMKN